MAAVQAQTLRSAFVTGGSGFLGHHLIGRLRSDGVSVNALARSVRAGQIVETAGAEAVMVRARSVAHALLLSHRITSACEASGPPA